VLPITPFPNGVSEDSHLPTKERVRLLVARGLSVTEIAAQLGVSKSTVCYHRTSLGIAGDRRYARRYDDTIAGARA
jgi:DNA-binding CsgD family transcriptional regulator